MIGRAAGPGSHIYTLYTPDITVPREKRTDALTPSRARHPTWTRDPSECEGEGGGAGGEGGWMREKYTYMYMYICMYIYGEEDRRVDPVAQRVDARSPPRLKRSTGVPHS